MSIYAKTDYRKILEVLLADRKKVDKKASLQQMADQTKIAKSYLSRVFKEKANLSSDQLFLVCDYLDLSTSQADYIQLLLELERCALDRRKKVLKQKIRQIQNQNLQTDKNIPIDVVTPEQSLLQEYFVDPLNQVLHMCLSIPKYQWTPKLLSTELGIPYEIFMHYISRLVRFGLIEWDGERIIVKKFDMHLPAESPAYTSWRDRLRLLALGHFHKLSKDDLYSFSATFTATEEARMQIKSNFLAFLNTTRDLVLNAEKEKTFQIHFDLFNWTK
ncbi:MAG: hypothetical protein AB7T49_01845 [Oligoflexales bacterium]